MNLEEYNRRKEKMHSVTGIPTYWEELQAMTAERDRWRKIAKTFYDAACYQNSTKTAEMMYEQEVANNES